jgi:hypothetical protein
MKILVTNNTMAFRSGSELYVQELTQELIARGHDVAVFSTQGGGLGEKMKEYGVAVVDDLDQLQWTPDIIHAQHHLETMISLAYFSRTPAVYFCHGWKPWQEHPPFHPRIVTYIAVDVKTQEKAIAEHNVPSDNINIMHNFVDLVRFEKRKSLPQKPQKALVFSNYAAQDNFLPYIQEACKKARISLDVVGLSSGNSIARPEEILGNYDLIFAVGRSALEALVSGVSVVICGVWGVGPIVTFQEVKKLRDFNFGVAAMHSELDADIIYKEICRYDSIDAMRVTDYLRERVGLDRAIDNIEKLYVDIIEKFSPLQIDAESDSQAHARYLKNIAIFLKQKDRLLQQRDQEIALMQKSKFWKMRNKYLAIKNILKNI